MKYRYQTKIEVDYDEGKHPSIAIMIDLRNDRTKCRVYGALKHEINIWSGHLDHRF